MNESTIVPDDITVLLECLQSNEDLQLEEMQPLRNWAKDAPDGEREISKALARNSHLGKQLENAEIVVPRMLQRNVHAYVLQNARAAADELVAEQAKMVARKKSKRPEKNKTLSRLQFSIGALIGLAALVLVGFFVVESSEWFSDLDATQVAQEAEGWFDGLEDDQKWSEGSFLKAEDFPFEISASPDWSTKIKTKYGQVTVLELFYKPQAPNQRAMLFVFNSTRPMSETALSASPQYVSENRCAGAAKNGDMVYALVVDGDQADYAALIRGGVAPLQTAAFQQFDSQDFFRRYSSLSSFRYEEGFSVSAAVASSSFEASF